MKTTPGEADLRLWAIVAATVRPLPGRRHKAVRPVKSAAPTAIVAPTGPAPTPPPTVAAKAPPGPVARDKRGPPPRVAPPPPAPVAAAPAIEPRRRLRLARERDLIADRLDLHGLDQDRARLALTRFVQRAHQDGARAVLVITGKGAMGDGILRRRVPDWLGEPPLRALVAGLSEAHRRHGGEGALYVALKR